MNRRYFLRTTAALAAVGRVSAHDKVVIGIMGVRGRGRYLINQFGPMPDVEIAYLCDVDQRLVERAMKTVESHGGARPRFVGDVRRMLDDGNVDAVVIATPNHWHAPATILACDAGKDVYVEKPISHNIREGRLMIEAAQRTGSVVQAGTQARSRPCIIRAMEYVHSGKLGKVLAAKAWNVQMRKSIGHMSDAEPPKGLDWDGYIGPAPWIPFRENRLHYNWHWNWNFGSGDVGNDGIHQLDMARWALQVDCPTTVTGMGRKMYFDDDQETPDTVNVTFDYGDKIMLFEMRDWNPYKMDGIENGVAVYGTEGMMHIGELAPGVWGFRVYDRKGEVALVDDANEHDTHARDFIDCVRNRSTTRGDLKAGHLSTIHAHLANIVARSGCGELKFDPQTEKFKSNPKANEYVGRRYRKHWATPKGV